MLVTSHNEDLCVLSSTLQKVKKQSSILNPTRCPSFFPKEPFSVPFPIHPENFLSILCSSVGSEFHSFRGGSSLKTH